MVQAGERFSERVVFYVTPTARRRLDRAVEDSEVGLADWLRRILEEALTGFESAAVSMQELGGEGELPPMVELAVARKEIEGLQAIIAQQRERLGMSDALNIELAKRLEEAHTTLNRVTLALPAAGESSSSGGFNWRFWRR